MNDTSFLDVETCINGLKARILNALIEPKHKGKWLGPSDVGKAAKIHDHFTDKEARKWTTPFTRALLFQLKKEGSVLGEARGPVRNGKPTIVWQLTDPG